MSEFDPRALFTAMFDAAVAADKFRILHLDFSWTMPYTFWAGLIGGCFLTTASHGTEQLMVQRLLAARNERESRKALMASWVVIFFQFSLFLLIRTFLVRRLVDQRPDFRPVPVAVTQLQLLRALRELLQEPVVNAIL